MTNYVVMTTIKKDEKNCEKQTNQTQELSPSLQNQIIAALICNLGAFSSGAAVGWTSPSLPDLQSSGFLTETEAAWTGGLYAIGGLVSVPIFGYVANTKGRKPAAYVIGISLVLGFALKAWGDSSYWLLFARFLCGIGGGSATALPPLYIGETSEPRARGLLSCFLMVENSLGLFYSYVLGALLPDIDMLPYALIPLPIIFLVLFWFMPETPIYRLRQGREEKAARALAWLRKLPLNSNEIKAELAQHASRQGLKLPLPPLPIKRRRRFSRRRPTPIFMRSPSATSNKDESEKEKLKSIKLANVVKQQVQNSFLIALKKLLASKSGRRGLLMCLWLTTAQSFTGLFAVAMYAVSIFEVSGSAISPNICAIFYALVLIFGSITGSLIIEKTGRRKLQICSCLVICICHLVLGISLQAVSNGKSNSFLSWLPLFALPICVFSYNAGVGNMPFVILSEVFTPEVQDIANTIVMIYIWITLFFLLQFFPICAGLIGFHNVFYLFSIVSLWAAVYAYYFLIETKGKSLEKILQELSNEKSQTKDEYVNEIENKANELLDVV